MGVKGLSKFLKKYAKDCTLQDLSNKKIAIDTSIYLYKFKYNTEGNEFIRKFLYQVVSFKKNNITPLYVFDGKPPVEKDKLKHIRQEKKENSINPINVSKEDTQALRELFDILGVFHITPETEGEKYCAYLNKIGKADAVFSNDFDTLVFGCNTLITYNTTALKSYNLQEILEDLDITLEQLIDISIACGTDYYISGIPRMGPSTSLKKIKKQKNIKEWENLPIDLDIENLRSLFTEFNFDENCNTIDVEASENLIENLQKYCEKYAIKVSKAVSSFLTKNC